MIEGYICLECGTKLNDAEGRLFTSCSDCWRSAYRERIRHAANNLDRSTPAGVPSQLGGGKSGSR